MIVSLRYFGVRTPFLSKENQKVALPTGATIEQLIEEISKIVEDPQSELLKKASFLVNKKGAKKDAILHDGDEVIILHAIGGG